MLCFEEGCGRLIALTVPINGTSLYTQTFVPCKCAVLSHSDPGLRHVTCLWSLVPEPIWCRQRLEMHFDFPFPLLLLFNALAHLLLLEKTYTASSNLTPQDSLLLSWAILSPYDYQHWSLSYEPPSSLRHVLEVLGRLYSHKPVHNTGIKNNSESTWVTMLVT